MKLETVANLPGVGCALYVRKRVFSVLNTVVVSENQWLIKVQGWFHTKVFDAMLPFIPQHVEPQTVLFRLNYIDQLLFQMDVLFVVDRAFEDRILHSLSEVEALLSDVSQASLAGFVASGDIEGHKDQHWILLRQGKWRWSAWNTETRASR